MRADTRLRLARAETPHTRLLEDVVACKDLIRAFAGEHDLQAILAHEAGEFEQRRGCGAKDRSLGEADHVGEAGRDVALRTMDGGVARAERAGHFRLECAFVVLDAVEGHGEGAQRLGRHAGGKRRDDGGIEAARQIRADRYVGAHADACSVRQEGAQFFRRRADRAVA